MRVAPDDVDVNIHPAKSEVRFRNPNYIFDLVRYAVRGALSRTTAPPQAAYPKAPAGPNHLQPYMALNEPASAYGVCGRQEEKAGLLFKEEDIIDVKNPEFLGLVIVGQLWGEFIVAHTPGGGGEAYLIDQHGAAERCAFEKLKKMYASGTVPSQALLLPERFETTPEEKEAVLGASQYLSAFGFEIMPFGHSTGSGGETFLIRTAPCLLSGRASAGLIKDLAQELSSFGGSSRVEERIDGALMRIACHSVIRGPRPLAKEEAAALLTDMARIDFSGHCPHGRPVVKRIPRGEIEAIFGR
ncbi:MAG: hypothetical protein A3I81_04555 [Deltaproteobacteria bacterium RIFCSPLOWO2_02_FULL_55_12]|nr:MAG: hypothetical protein A3I81_04555 [Deltaproteobacteria bacterium RIFCSPLOWO2_02_FULL_55_12]